MIQQNSSFFQWLLTNWSRAGAITAAVLFLLVPFLWPVLGPFMAVFLSLPLYMVHQYEEHGHGAFKAYINGALGEGSVTDLDIAFINLGYIWVCFGLCLYLAFFVTPEFGLFPIYFLLINTVMHIRTALIKKAYNPGLWTALSFFIPFGSLALFWYSRALSPAWFSHVICIVLIVAIHLDIMARARQKRHFLGR